MFCGYDCVHVCAYVALLLLLLLCACVYACYVVVFVFILEENGQHFQLLIYLDLCIIIAIVIISCL